MPLYLFQMAVTVVGISIYVFGGDDGLTQTDNIFKYDTVSNVWTQLNEHCPLIGYEPTHAVTLSDGMVYIVGAGDSCLNTVQFDRASRKFKQLTPLPEEVKHTYRESGSCFVRRDCLYFTCTGEFYMQVYRYCVESNTWTKIIRGFTGKIINQEYGQALTIMVPNQSGKLLKLDEMENESTVEHDTSTDEDESEEEDLVNMVDLEASLAALGNRN
jgi:hypothetical protein